MNKVAMYKREIYKEAKEPEKSNAGNIALMGGGAYAVKKQFDKGNITGRESLYHTTHKDNVKNIRERGLRATKAKDPNNLTHIAIGSYIDEKDLKGKTYTFKKKGHARMQGLGAAVSDMVGNDKGFKDAFKRKILKVKAPVWKMKTTDNPELLGAKTPKEYLERAKVKKVPAVQQMDAAGTPESIQRWAAKKKLKMLGKDTHVFSHGISPRYIKGSKYYQKAGSKEVLDFIKKNPKRFAKGAGIALAGAAAVGIGAKKILDKNKKG